MKMKIIFGRLLPYIQMKYGNKEKMWFTDFSKTKPNPTATEILDFHQFTESENKEFGLQINRNNTLKRLVLLNVC